MMKNFNDLHAVHTAILQKTTMSTKNTALISTKYTTYVKVRPLYFRIQKEIQRTTEKKKTFFLSIKVCDEWHTINLNIQTSVFIYSITLINTCNCVYYNIQPNIYKYNINKYNTLHTQFSLHKSNLTNQYWTTTHWWFQYTKSIYVYSDESEISESSIFWPDARGIGTRFRKYIPLK